MGFKLLHGNSLTKAYQSFKQQNISFNKRLKKTGSLFTKYPGANNEHNYSITKSLPKMISTGLPKIDAYQIAVDYKRNPCK